MLKLARQQPEKYPWLTRLLARKPFRVVALALANKMARIVPGRCWPRAAPIACQYLRQRRKESADGRMRLRLCVLELQGDDDVNAKRSRPSIGKPVWADAILERVLMSGTDQRITSRPAATAAASRPR